MNCPAREQIERLLDNNLSDTERDAIAAHVDACVECQQTMLAIATAGRDEDWFGAAAASGDRSGEDTDSSTPCDAISSPPPMAAPTPSNMPPTAAEDSAADESRPDTAPDILGYEILRKLGQGGMGVVYQARQVSPKRIVAIKFLLAGQHATAADVTRFRKEAEAAAKLQHPHIVAIHEVGSRDGHHYFTMDFIENGRTLADIVRERPLEGRRAATYLKKVAEAIHFAHDRGILHRDIKPSNILVDEFDQPRVTDFGLAKQVADQERLTASGAIIGTPEYMPPEMASGNRAAVGPASDVYSLGATLYELFTGRPPFQAATPIDTILQVLRDEPVAPRRLNRQIDRDLETICLHCLSKEPCGRYGSARDLADDIGCFLRGEPIRARPVGSLGRAWRWCRRNPKLAAITATLLCSFLIGSGGVTWQWRRAEKSAQTIRHHRDLALKSLVEITSLTTELKNGPGMPALTNHILEAASGLEPFLETDSATSTMKRAVAGVHAGLGVHCLWTGQLEKARTHLRRQRALLEELLVSDPSDLSLQDTLAESLNRLGYVEKQAFDFPAAVECFQSSAAIYRKVIASIPTDVERATRGLNSNEAEAEICLMAPQAIESLDFTLSRRPRQAGSLLVIRAQVLASLGRIQEVIETAKKLEALDPQSGQNLFNVACCYSLCAGVIAKGRSTQEFSSDETATYTGYRSLAVQFLDKAALHGWNNPDHVAWLETDIDLAAIREDPDFRKLFKRLKRALEDGTNE